MDRPITVPRAASRSKRGAVKSKDTPAAGRGRGGTQRAAPQPTEAPARTASSFIVASNSNSVDEGGDDQADPGRQAKKPPRSKPKAAFKRARAPCTAPVCARAHRRPRARSSTQVADPQERRNVSQPCTWHTIEPRGFACCTAGAARRATAVGRMASAANRAGTLTVLLIVQACWWPHECKCKWRAPLRCPSPVLSGALPVSEMIPRARSRKGALDHGAFVQPKPKPKPARPRQATKKKSGSRTTAQKELEPRIPRKQAAAAVPVAAAAQKRTVVVHSPVRAPCSPVRRPASDDDDGDTSSLPLQQAGAQEEEVSFEADVEISPMKIVITPRNATPSQRGSTPPREALPSFASPSPSPSRERSGASEAPGRVFASPSHIVFGPPRPEPSHARMG